MKSELWPFFPPIDENSVIYWSLNVSDYLLSVRVSSVCFFVDLEKTDYLKSKHWWSFQFELETECLVCGSRRKPSALLVEFNCSNWSQHFQSSLKAVVRINKDVNLDEVNPSIRQLLEPIEKADSPLLFLPPPLRPGGGARSWRSCRRGSLSVGFFWCVCGCGVTDVMALRNSVYPRGRGLECCCFQSLNLISVTVPWVLMII